MRKSIFKKLTAAMLCMVFAVSVFGCGSKKSNLSSCELKDGVIELNGTEFVLPKMTTEEFYKKLDQKWVGKQDYTNEDVLAAATNTVDFQYTDGAYNTEEKADIEIQSRYKGESKAENVQYKETTLISMTIKNDPSGTFKMAKNITLNASYDDIVAAYGTPETPYGQDYLIYKYSFDYERKIGELMFVKYILYMSDSKLQSVDIEIGIFDASLSGN